MCNTSSTEETIERAKQLARVRTLAELREILRHGLGNTPSGRKILNNADFSMAQIAVLRATLTKTKGE